jgi:hypothetical protein
VAERRTVIVGEFRVPAQITDPEPGLRFFVPAVHDDELLVRRVYELGVLAIRIPSREISTVYRNRELRRRSVGEILVAVGRGDRLCVFWVEYFWGEHWFAFERTRLVAQATDGWKQRLGLHRRSDEGAMFAVDVIFPSIKEWLSSVKFGGRNGSGHPGRAVSEFVDYHESPRSVFAERLVRGKLRSLDFDYLAWLISFPFNEERGEISREGVCGEEPAIEEEIKKVLIFLGNGRIDLRSAANASRQLTNSPALSFTQSDREAPG